MAIEILTDVILPNLVWSKGVRGAQVRKNQRAESGSGIPSVNILHDTTKREFTFGTVPMFIEAWQALEGAYEVTDAGAYGCLLQDPKDPSASHETGRVTLISAPAHTYQMVKRYTSVGSSLTHDRIIRHVHAGNFELKVSGTPLVTPDDYTFDANTGVITIPSDPAPGTVTWASIIYVPVHFTDDRLEWELIVAGNEDQRMFAGPTVVVEEVKVAA